MRLRPAAASDVTIGGVVRDEAGSSVVGAEVSARGDAAANPQEIARTTVTDASGHFELAHVDGTYALKARAKNGDEGFAQNVAAGTRDVTLVVKHATGMIAGVVHERNGAPVAAFDVTLQSRAIGWDPISTTERSVFSADGTFTLGPLTTGTYDVQVFAQSFAPSAPHAVRVGVGEQALTFTLDRGAQLHGHVVDATDGTAVSRAFVSLDSGGGTVADESGAFTLGPAPPQGATITVVAAGHHGRMIVATPAQETRVALERVAEGETSRIQFAGIGATLRPDATGLAVIALVPGSAAGEAGIVVGDTITGIDGEEVATLSGSPFERIRGAAGTVVALEVRKANGDVALVEVTRKDVR
jgi:hypothetical protein